MTDEKCKDIYRESWVRYLGYSNEVGEAFRPLVPRKLVRFSYTIAFTYVFADTVDKGVRMFVEDGRPRNVLVASGDALLWQTLASIIIPGITINRICAYSGRSLAKCKKIPPRLRAPLSVAIGLASIPIIILPIDFGVTILMNHTYRKWVT